MSVQKFCLFLLVLLLAPSVHTQQKKPALKPPAAAVDQLGLTCAQLLQMISTEWVAKFQQANPGAEGAVRAISSYGKCYDARTDLLGVCPRIHFATHIVWSAPSGNTTSCGWSGRISNTRTGS